MGDEQDHEVADILRHISASLTNLETAVLPEAYYYSSLPLCVIDAVYSIGVNYESTRRTVSTWCDAQAPPWRRVCNELAERGDHTMAEFVVLLTQTSAEELANSVFKNKQRTSAKNGILKAEAISLFAKVLVDSKIENFSDTEDETKIASAREGVVRIPGQGSGISFDYFLMLAGKDEAVKSDRMIRGFVADALHLPSVSANTARALVLSASQSLKSTFPNLTPRLLDYEIWKFQRSNSTGASVKRAIGQSRPASRKKVRIDEDHHGWLLAQASLLRSERHGALDRTNLAEELEAMAAAIRREIKASSGHDDS